MPLEVIHMTIGQRISDLRKRYSYSQEYVAEQLDVSRQAVSKWETGQTEPDTSNLIALAALFHVTVEYLAVGKVADERAENGQFSVKTSVGFLLLGMGLLSLILAGLFSEMASVLLFILAMYLLAGGILCFVKSRYVRYISLWTFWVITAFVLFVMAGHNPLTLFLIPFALSIGTIVDVLFWVGLTASIAITVIKLFRIKKSK